MKFRKQWDKPLKPSPEYLDPGDPVEGFIEHDADDPGKLLELLHAGADVPLVHLPNQELEDLTSDTFVDDFSFYDEIDRVQRTGSVPDGAQDPSKKEKDSTQIEKVEKDEGKSERK